MNWSLTLKLSILSFILFSCHDDLTDSAKPAESGSYFSEREHEMIGTISFSLEAISYGELSDRGSGKTANMLDVIGNQQSIDRQDIQIAIYPDGTIDLVAEKAKPLRLETSDAFKDVPPSDVAPVHRTVIENGIASLYTKSGALLHQKPMDIEDSGALVSFQKLLGRYDWNKYVEDSGASMELLNNDTYIIRTKLPADQVPPPTAGSVQKSYEGMYQEEVVVADLNILLGSSLHLADGTTIMRNVYKYKSPTGDGVWLPEMSYHEEFLDNTITGSATIVKTTNFYDDFVIKKTK